ncbi:hypothetical protein [Rhodanobacter sp. MP1X3]|uniref:hypothetical protein n=1 Tax=Rhodanobacter sp. MP1X3 TaxID=2723086 RepID=UPI00160BA289|nr:hypothetical protein [Rhodanobacter sp. MP1X3]MBB6242436.1 hypothetical protein [Rhodanobacter sp. MP1X3]
MSYFSKITQTRFLAAFLLTALLSACSYNMNQNSIMESVVQTVAVGNGKVLSVGYKLPDASAGCQLINESSRNWYLAQNLGVVKAGGGRQVLQDEAVESVKQRPQDGINYVALTIPNEAGIGVVNITPTREAKTSYFRCANPPQSR